MKIGCSQVIRGLNAVLAAGLILTVFALLSDVLQSTMKKSGTTAKGEGRRENVSPPARFQDYETILSQNPFGSPPGRLVMLSDQTVAASQGDLKLVGTVSGKGRRGYAIFMDTSSKQTVVRTGDSIEGYGVLKSVRKDTAVIDRSGNILEISLIDRETPDDTAMKTPGQSDKPSIGTGFVKSMGKGTYIVDQKTILHALENPNQLMTDARLQPNINAGKQEGFILRELKSGGIYQTLGLQNNDILLRINNFDIASPDTALQAFTALRGMDRVDLDILRNGTRTTLTYQIR